MRKIIIPTVFAVLLLLSLGSQQAFATTIDFDTFPDGTSVPDSTRITDQYASCGVKLFTTEVPEGPQAFSFSAVGGSPPNQLGADGPPGNPAFTHSIGVQFVSPVSQASIIAIDVGFNGLILEAFNSANVLVDSVQVINPTNPPNQADLMTISGSDIVDLLIRQVTPGGIQGIIIDGYNIDDLQFPGPPCDIQVIGGTLIPIDTTALLLAGMQSISMWMIPVVAAGIVIGVLVIKRRK